MYESPIQLAIGEMQMKYEDEVYKCIQQYGINVDKDELIRALQYDRDQYKKGYRDAVMKFTDVVKEWVFKEMRQDCSAGLACDFIEFIDDIKKEMVGDV